MAEEINLFEAPEEPSFFIGQVQSDIFDSPDSFYKVLAVLCRSHNTVHFLSSISAYGKNGYKIGSKIMLTTVATRISGTPAFA